MNTTPAHASPFSGQDSLPDRCELEAHCTMATAYVLALHCNRKEQYLAGTWWPSQPCHDAYMNNRLDEYLLAKLRDEESVRILVDMPETPEAQHGSLEATQVYDGPEPLEYALFPETRRPESEAMGPLARLLDDAYHSMV